MLPEHGRWAEVAWRELTQVRSEPHSLPLVEDARWLAALALEARNIAVACNTLSRAGWMTRVVYWICGRWTSVSRNAWSSAKSLTTSAPSHGPSRDPTVRMIGVECRVFLKDSTAARGVKSITLIE